MRICICLATVGIWAMSLPCLSYGQAKIIGGGKAPKDNYKWIAALATTGSGSLYSRQFCGASLVAPDWVVTAAHCVEGDLPNKLQVVVGVNDLNDSSESEIRGVKGIFIHPGYKERKGDQFNDIALLLLSAPVTTITPITYAHPSEVPPMGTSLRVLGWGETNASPNYPMSLHMADLKLTPLGLANQYYGKVLNRRHLAAMATGKDTCGGDSGGPLVEMRGKSGEPLLQGITSYGIGCAQSKVPGIYTNVSNYAKWLDQFLAQPTTGEPAIAVYGRKGMMVPAQLKKTSIKRGTNFGRRFKSGRSVKRRFVVQNTGSGLPLSLPRIRVTTRHFSILSSPKYLLRGKRGKIMVRFRAPSVRRAGRVRAVLRIHTNDPSMKRYAFRLQARYQANRELR